jgi:hypothetical protein
MPEEWRQRKSLSSRKMKRSNVDFESIRWHALDKSSKSIGLAMALMPTSARGLHATFIGTPDDGIVNPAVFARCDDRAAPLTDIVCFY